jgi:2,3-bisphosphoglycerate-dependent phosphoglycerate mutase
MNLILLRHGESKWNRDKRFTGWTDVDLSEQGIQETHQAARMLSKAGYSLDVAYTSVLKRAIRTLWIVLDDLDCLWLPVYRRSAPLAGGEGRGGR